ncbi:MAG: hypothetical protein QMC95_18070, partial [Desulfitobacteriaceae bacterium]|nr:hypothetical protein [Desulfitobacteriaceae bacterium]
MGRTMRRGKQQVLLELLPGKTFDFERVAIIAQVESIRGVQRTDLNIAVVLQKVAEEAQAWEERFRLALRDDVLRDPSRFVLLEPKGVQAQMFPRVFWCQNRACGRVIDYSDHDTPLPITCPVCGFGKLVQLRFVKVHRCGVLQPLLPPTCQRCGKATYMALDTRGSERIANFRWICRSCNNTMALFGGRCHHCDWPGTDGRLKNMDIEVHRAGRTFYTHTVVLLNVPERRLDAFFNLPEWPAIAAAKFLGLPEIFGRSLNDFTASARSSKAASDVGLSGDELDDLLRRQARGELTAEQVVAEMQMLRQLRQQERQSSLPNRIVQALEQRTGVPWSTWKQAG